MTSWWHLAPSEAGLKLCCVLTICPLISQLAEIGVVVVFSPHQDYLLSVVLMSYIIITSEDVQHQ